MKTIIEALLGITIFLTGAKIFSLIFWTTAVNIILDNIEFTEEKHADNN